MITPHGPRSDWFVIDDDQARQLALAPRVMRDEKLGIWLAHRSHLPLIGEVITSASPRYAVEFSDGTRLRDYQETGAAFLSSRRGTLIADGMRTGKTATCVAAHDPADGPLVVVGPLAVRSVWLDWFRRRWPDKQAAVLQGRTYDAGATQADLIFTHYDILSKWQSVGLTRAIGTLVFDEAHALANKQSKRTQAALLMSAGAHKIICATGTPLWNKAAGLWSILSITNPAAWGTFREFTERYCSGMPGAYGWTTGAPSNIDELKHRLAEVMIRRTWRDIRAELPPLTRSVETSPVLARDALELDKIAAQIRDEIGTGQITAIGELARIRQIVAKEKTKIAIECARRIAGSGEPCVVWTWHRSVAADIREKLANKKIPVEIMTGDTPMSRREVALSEWRKQSNGVLVVSMAVAPAGIDLSHAAHCIFAELDWTPATMGQAAMRTFSPDRPNFETYIVAEHEIDQRLIEVLISKCDTATQLGVPATDTQTIAFDVFSSEEPADLDRLTQRIAQRSQG